MSVAAVLIIAILQGITELFPISSLGHAVVLPALFGLAINQSDPSFLPFLVVLHLGTAVALLIYFRKDWIGIFRGIFLTRGLDWRDRIRPIELIVIATIPAVVIGKVLEHPLRDLFGKPLIAAAFLAVNGLLLFVGERIRRSRAAEGEGKTEATALTRKGALAIGFWQCLAFIPGLSRSGATLVGGLLAGLTHEAAAHFSFLIATPVILGAGVLEVPKLMHQSVSGGTAALSVMGGIVAGIVAYLSTAFLMRYFRSHEFKALDPFAWYCALGGLAAFVILGLR
ncbi:MAG TPA: undecaprenyl-diphosphate phosphatase [Magnetospirillaceae bacterium]|jgi:undecaprenyl-diphosphatase